MTPEQARKYMEDSNAGRVVWDDNARGQAEAVLRGSGGQVGGQTQYGGQQSFGGGGGDVLGMAQQIAGFGQQQQSGVVNSLSDRYKALLEQVGNQASRELGARGIPISSDMSQTFIRNRQGNDPSVLNAATMLNQQQNLPYQQGLEAAMTQLGNQPQMARLEFDRQQFEYQKQQDALNRQSLGGLSGGIGGAGQPFTPTSSMPKATPGGGMTPTAGFKPIGATQQTANNGFNPSPFSGQNVQYAGQQAAKLGGSALNTASRIAQSTPQYKAATNLYNTAQNVARSQPVQNVVKNVSTAGRNIASGATNLFKSIFG